MKYNQYTWNLYKQTTIGKEMIQFFSDAKGYTLFSRYCPHAYFISEDLYNDWLENIYCYGVSDYDQPTSLDEAKDLYISLATLGIIYLESFSLYLMSYHGSHPNISFRTYFFAGYSS